MNKKLNYHWFSKVLKSENKRTEKLKKNIFFSIGIKGGNIAIGLVLMPLLINFINPVQYGIWLTLSSIVNWMSFFDIGLGNGLRNKLAVEVALNNFEDSRVYVSSTYLLLLLITCILFLIFLIINPFINWVNFLNLPQNYTEDISVILLIIFSSFCVQFVLQIINTILIALQYPAKAALNNFLGQLAVLICVIVLRQFIKGSLITIVLVMTVLPNLVLLISSFLYYRKSLKFIRPDFKKFNLNHAKNIFKTGGLFFVIQICVLIIFQTDNIIITKTIGPESVTTFNVCYRLFSVITMLFSIIIAPFWSAFTDAHAKQEYDWIRKKMRVMRKFFLGATIVGLLVFLLSPIILKIWIGEKVHVSGMLSFAMFVYIVCTIWMNLHVYLLNGLGKLRLQFILMIISVLINIPLAIWWAKQFDLIGVAWANAIVSALMGLFFYIQSQKILNKTASGIWNK